MELLAYFLLLAAWFVFVYGIYFLIFRGIWRWITGASKAPTQHYPSFTDQKPTVRETQNSVVSRSSVKEELARLLGIRITGYGEGLCKSSDWFGVSDAGEPKWIIQIDGSIDRSIQNGASAVTRAPNAQGRITWGSIKRENGLWSILLIVAFGTKDNAFVQVIEWADWMQDRRVQDAVLKQLSLLGESPQWYVVPRITLWDGTGDFSRGVIVGYNFGESHTPSGPLRPIHMLSKGAQTVAMSKHPAGTIRVAQFQPNVFGLAEGGGWFA